MQGLVLFKWTVGLAPERSTRMISLRVELSHLLPKLHK